VGKKRVMKNLNPKAHLFVNTNYYQIPESGRVVEEGELIKIVGEHGKRFKFKQHVKRTDNDIEWIDCIEIEKGLSAGWRSFRPDRIKPLPKSRRQKRAA
jgi:hypothetical protein